MKNLKLLIALAICVCMLFTVSYATSGFLKIDDIEYTNGENITVTVKAAKDYTACYFTASVNFDNTAWEFVSAQNAAGVSSALNVGGTWIDVLTASTASFSANDTLCTLTFSPVGSNQVGSEFSLSGIMIMDDAMTVWDESTDKTDVKIVTAAGGSASIGETAITGSEAATTVTGTATGLGHTYTDVFVVSGAVDVTGTLTNPTLTATVKYDGSAVTKNITPATLNGTFTGTGAITFKAAIINTSAGFDITKVVVTPVLVTE